MNAMIEAWWGAWADAIDLAAKLRTMVLARVVDGIRFDADGNPTSYDVLQYHPGSPWRSVHPGGFNTWPAASVCHLFHAGRPGQHRGVPEILPALALLPGLRRYTQATIKAAEAAFI